MKEVFWKQGKDKGNTKTMSGRIVSIRLERLL